MLIEKEKKTKQNVYIITFPTNGQRCINSPSLTTKTYNIIKYNNNQIKILKYTLHTHK